MTVSLRTFTALGPLSLIALALACGGTIRLGQGFGMAFALQANAESSAPQSAPLTCADPPERLLEALRERDLAVTAREAALQERLAALELAERALDTRLQELVAAEDALAKTLAIADDAAESDLARLTTVFEAMKPADAANLFQTMAPDFAAGFLSRMRPETAAAILGGLPPDAAYSLSVLVAGRNARAPVE